MGTLLLCFLVLNHGDSFFKRYFLISFTDSNVFALLQPILFRTGKQLFNVLIRPGRQPRVFVNLMVKEKI